MPDPHDIFLTFLFWAVVVMRAPGAIRSIQQRMLWLGLLLTAMSKTFKWPGIREGMDALTGWAGSGNLLAQLLGVLGMAAFVQWILSLNLGRGKLDPIPVGALRRSRVMWAIALLAVTIMACTQLFAGVNAETVFEQVGGDFARTGPADWAYVATFELYLTYAMASLGWAMGIPGLILWRRKQKGHRLLAVFLIIGGIGSIAFNSRAVYTFSYLIPDLLGVAVWPGRWSEEIAHFLHDPGILLVLIGLAGPAGFAGADWWRDQVMLNSLRPLRGELRKVFPHLAMGGGLGMTARMKLIDASVEMLGALVELSKVSDRSAFEEAKRRADAAGVPADRVEAAAMATWVTEALSAYRTGARPDGPGWPVGRGLEGPLATADWLAALAREFRQVQAGGRPMAVQA